MSRTLVRVAPPALAVGALLLCSAWAAPARCGERPGGGGPRPPVPVTAAAVVKKAMPVEVATFGTVEANATVTIKPQVTGVIDKVCFKEGQAVAAGDDLFAIDARPFAAALTRAKAEFANAGSELKRQEELEASGGTTKSAKEQAETNLAAAKAALELAKLNVEYCAIKSPIGGRAGAYLADAGNMVKSGDTALVVINQVRPIQVSFVVPQRNLAEIRARMAEGKLKVEASIPGQAGSETGELAFVDNAVDSSTGTVRLKAVFANEAERLWPGQFVNVKLVLRVVENALVVPSGAVQTGQGGQYLYVLEGPATQEQPGSARMIDGVRVEFEVGEESVIDCRGLEPGDRVITDGQLRITKDSKVYVKGTEKPPGDKPGQGRKPAEAPRP